MLQVINWENILILHLSKYGSAFTSTLGRYRIFRETATSTSTVEESKPNMHLNIMGLFDGDPTCRFCRMETETVQHIICCCEALARQHCNILGRLTAEPKDISTASVRDLCLFIRGTGLLNLR
jgi:hypothetical protein